MNRIKRILYWIDALNQWTGKIISILVIIIALNMFYGVIMRYFFDAAPTWTYELSSMLLITLFMLGAGNAHFHDAHIRMDALYEKLSKKNKAIMDLVTSVFFFFFCGLTIWVTLNQGIHSFLIKERSASVWHPYIWPIKLIMPLGFILLLLQGIAKYIRDLLTLVKKED